ncbi:MAG: gliding motility protein GldE [bacterium]|nr:MAG: gliding motility protein GldE [bacterium]
MILLTLISIILLIIILSALCSMVEAALFTVPLTRVKSWVESNLRSSSALLQIKEAMQKPIATIVIINNISNIVGSIIVGGLMTQIFNKLAVGIFSGVFTFLIIIFSEIIPKTLGERYADSIALYSAKSILFLTRVFNPILIVIEKATKPIVKDKVYPSVSEHEIKMLAYLGSREGVLEKEEANIIKNALLLNDIKVKEIMTPRIKMVGFEEGQSLNDIRDELFDIPFSRVPLYKTSMDKVTGLLYKLDALKSICDGQTNMPLSDLRKDCLFIPGNKPIDKLMEELRITQSHTAIVIDEYGGTAGLVTLEDILEQLVGNIVGAEDSTEEKMVVISKDEIIAPGSTLIDEVNEFFKSSLENHRTVSKFILDHLNRFPDNHEHIEWDDLMFIIEEITEKTIEKVRIRRDPQSVDQEDIPGGE